MIYGIAFEAVSDFITVFVVFSVFLWIAKRLTAVKLLRGMLVSLPVLVVAAGLSRFLILLRVPFEVSQMQYLLPIIASLGPLSTTGARSGGKSLAARVAKPGTAAASISIGFLSINVGLSQADHQDAVVRR